MKNNNPMPSEKGMDHTVNLLKEGYSFILNRRERFESDVFETRILGEKAICMVGEEAAQFFYDTEKFKREGAAPNRVQETLLGKGGVQGLDGSPHSNRKEMFMSIMTKDALEKMNQLIEDKWQEASTKWEKQDSILFYDEVKELLLRAACEWAGVPIKEKEIPKLAEEIGTLFESAAAIGPKHWKGRHSRNKVEKWIEGLVKEVREGKLEPDNNTALKEFSWHRDLSGELLDEETVAVEVINIVRPIVAISVFINFTVLALHDYPEEKEKIRKQEEKYQEHFIQEVRRFYPFFPFAVAYVKNGFIWNDYKFEAGTLTLLDLHGTNMHPGMWKDPTLFRPERFSNWKESPFAFIPQGGGDYFMGHRCTGEWITVEIMKKSLDFLMNKMNYTLPDQDLSMSDNEIPNVPDDKMVMENIEKI